MGGHRVRLGFLNELARGDLGEGKKNGMEGKRRHEVI